MNGACRVTVGLLLVLATGLASPDEKSWPQLSGQICIERPESSGVLNIHAAEVVIEGGPVLTLVGGQAACAAVPAGQHTLWVQSQDPYDPTSADPKAWTSSAITLDVAGGGRAEFHLCGEAAGSAYTGWAFHTAGERCE